jgi:dTDP-glucose 4,6-dehydratase/UDP-glucuronate decarboxylase
VSDFVVSLLRVIARGADGEAYNIGDDREEITMRDLAERIRRLVRGSGSVVVRESAEPEYLADNPQRRCPNLDKLRALGGAMPVVSLDEGLARYVRWLDAEEGREAGGASGDGE